MKANKIIYWIVTILLCGWMVQMGVNFLVNFELTKEFFSTLYVTPVLIAPLATAKFLAVIAIITNRSETLKGLAYSGLLTDFLSAIYVHLNAGDGLWPMPSGALLLLILSFFFWRKISRDLKPLF